MKRLAWLFCAPLVLSLPMLAHAENGFATANVNLRAGPDISYPRITTVPAGARMDIQGCTEGWEWCDVITLGTRGWVSGGYVQYEYENQRVVVEDYGSRIGIPVISFVIGSYWADHYRDRPFYQRRDYWSHRPIRHRPLPSRPPPIGHRPAPPRFETNRPDTHRPDTHRQGNTHRLPLPPSQRPSSPPMQMHRPAFGHPHPVPAGRPASGAGHDRGSRPSTPAPTINRPATTPANHARPELRPAPRPAERPAAHTAPRPSVRPAAQPARPAARPPSSPAHAEKQKDKDKRKHGH